MLEHAGQPARLCTWQCLPMFSELDSFLGLLGWVAHRPPHWRGSQDGA